MKIDFNRLLSEKRYLYEVEGEEENPYHYELSFEMRNGYKIPLTITFNPLFPSQLPVVHINENRHIIPDIPHVTRSGMVCFLDEEGVVWNDNPTKTIDFVFKRVEQVLLSNLPEIEYHREFSYYFATLENMQLIFSVYTPQDEPEEISVLTVRDEPFAFLTDDMESKSMLSRVLGTKITTSNLSKAFFIPLDHAYEEITKLIKNHLTEEKLSKVNEFRMNKKRYFYLVSIPLLTGEKTLIGLWYERVNHSDSKRVNPIIDEGIAGNFQVTPLFILRNDDTTLIERGGGVKKNPNTLLIGCGSVGSDLLFLLARSGIKQFTLIDNEELEIENTYRHFLGMNKSFQRKPKVELLKEEFENRYPNVQIKTIENEVLTTIENDDINLDDYDLILIALGNPNIERRLNKHILQSSTPAIFTWVEAYGIGGHTLVVNNGGKGCYECLIDEELMMYQSFAGKSDKPFIKNMNGCAGSFTPYGSMDSMETALLASRVVLRLLDNEITGNPLLSWKGSAKAFKENGFTTSERFNQSLEYLSQENYEYINCNCQLCSEVKGEEH